jgi:hypothetical protein
VLRSHPSHELYGAGALKETSPYRIANFKFN